MPKRETGGHFRTLPRVKLFKRMTTKHSAVLDLFRNLYRWDPVHAEYQLAQLDTETKENSILFMLLESD